MGKRTNKYSGTKMNRKARRKHDRETIAALGLLLNATWTGHYFMKYIAHGDNGEMFYQYFDRHGNKITAIEANSLTPAVQKTARRLGVRRRGKSVTTQGNFLRPSLSRKGRDVMDGAFEPIHNDPLYHPTMGR